MRLFCGVNNIFLSKKKQSEISLCFFVPRAGIEPALPKEQDFESSASTSSATEAFKMLSAVKQVQK
jgi:hypothetical protein